MEWSVIVCHCVRVNDCAIRAMAAAGATDVDHVAELCGATGRCGTCRPVVEEILSESPCLVRTAAAA